MKTWPAITLRFTAAPSERAPETADLASAALDDFRPTAVEEAPDAWRVFFTSPADRDQAAAALPRLLAGAATVEPLDVPDEDWARRSQQDLTAVQVGRVTIAPPWATPAAPEPGQIVIVIQPSMGFGTGHHASTRLCTALLQRIDLAGRRVFDVGTGSGVLALVARALGAQAVVAVDDDPDAVEAARENLELNGVTDGIALTVSDFRALAATPADVVTANLTGGLLIRGAAVLASAVKAGGSLVISGVTLEEEAAVLDALASAFTLDERVSEDEWMGGLLRRR